MNQAGHFTLDYLKRDQTLSFLIALAFHVSLLAIGGIVFVKPAQFAVESGVSGIEVYLAAAPQESVAEMLKEEIKISATIPQDAILLPVEQPVDEMKSVERKLEDVSPSVGKGNMTLSSIAGVQTEAQPNYLRNPAPVYPFEARRLGQQGLVVLSVDVDRQGNSVQVKVKRSSRYLLLDNSALKTVRRWKYSPARIGELAIESNVEVPIRFKLENNH